MTYLFFSLILNMFLSNMTMTDFNSLSDSERAGIIIVDDEVN